MKVTVITTVYNRVADLDKTMQSVLQFARPGLDYIVIDGGSTDGSVELIKAHSDQLVHWLSEPDDGVYDAMNKGWAIADPDSRVIFLGAGDLLLSLPENPVSGEEPPAVLYGDVQLDQGRVFHARSGFRLKLFNSLHHQALMIPKRLHPEPPFNLAYPLYADFDFNQRLYKRNVKFMFEPALQSYAAPGGLTEHLYLNELTRIVRKNFGFFWWALSLAGFSFAKCLPPLKRFNPINRL